MTRANQPLILLTVIIVAALGCGQREPLWQRAEPAAVQAIREVVAPAKSQATAGPTAVAATFKHSGGFVALSGRFKLVGAPPAREQLNITKDPGVCAPSGATVYSERLIVAADGGIANVCIYLLSEPNRQIPVHPSAVKPAEGARPLMDQKACLFLPHVLAFHVGGVNSLALKNSDSVPHNTNIVAINQTSGNPTIGANQATDFALKPGVEEKLPFPVTCGFHPWMKGYILPRSNGYFAVTGADGRFELKNLPTGDRLTLVLWHESTGGRGGYLKKFAVKVPDIKPAREGFSITLEKDKPMVDVEFEVPLDAF